MPDEHASSPHTPDPLDLDKIDGEIRINELTEELKELGMGPSFVSEDCPPELHEQFLRNIIDIESAPLTSHFERLTKHGIELPPPDSLDDAALHAKLWEMFNALAAMDTFICSTDHMSDRQLYEHLWTDTLREKTTIMPQGSGWTCHLDLVSSGSDEDNENLLRYYFDEKTRQSWAKDFPNDTIPPHEKPPYDRDRHLPGASRQSPTSELPEFELDESDLDEFDEE